jgi:ferric-dicitrate binding protein FerR (iron transport regulator)
MRTTPTPESDEQLNKMLGEWVVDAPLPPRFEEQVWRRIERSETAADAPPLTRLFRSVAESFTRPKVAYAYVAVLLAVGMAAGSWTAQVKSNQVETALGERYVGSVDPYKFTVAGR